MTQSKPTGFLDEKFFETLEKYKNISEMTTDEGFKFYAPKFLEVGAGKRLEQVKAELGEINYKLGLLSDFKRNFDKYELEIAGKNWFYVEAEEMERRQRVYGFLAHNYNYGVRRKTFKELNDKKAALMEEYRCLYSILTGDYYKKSKENIQYYKNLPMANAHFEYLAEHLMAFAELFRTHELVTKYKLREGISRETFDRILDEVAALNGKKKKDDEPPPSGYEQLSLF